MPMKVTAKKAQYLKRKKEGLCPRCGAKRKKNEKFIYCGDCRAFFRDYSDGIADKINQKRKDRYEERKDNNECPRCGKRLGKSYKKTICPTCLEKQYKYNYRKDRPRVKSAASSVSKPAVKKPAAKKPAPKKKTKKRA